GGGRPDLRGEGVRRAAQLQPATDVGQADACGVDGQEEVGERHTVTTSSPFPATSGAGPRTNELNESIPSALWCGTRAGDDSFVSFVRRAYQRSAGAPGLPVFTLAGQASPRSRKTASASTSLAAGMLRLKALC